MYLPLHKIERIDEEEEEEDEVTSSIPYESILTSHNSDYGPLLTTLVSGPKNQRILLGLIRPAPTIIFILSSKYPMTIPPKGL